MHPAAMIGRLRRDIVAASDDFNRANGALGSNWAAATGHTSLTIVGNVASGSAQAGSYWNAFAFPPDQWAEATLTVGATICVRWTPGSDNLGASGYFVATNQIQIYKIVAGGYTQIGTTITNTTGATPRVRIEMVGTAIRVYLNGVLVRTASDASISTGRPGLFSNGGSLENWQAGFM